MATASSAEIQSDVNNDSDALLPAHAPRQQVAARGFGRDAHVRERREQARVVGHEHEVAVREHREAEPDRGAVHRRHQRLGEVLEGVDERGEAVARDRFATDAGVDGRGHLEQVGPRAEGLARAGEHDDGDVVVGFRGAQRVGSRVVQLLVERVGAVGPVEREQADAVAVFSGEDVVHHGRSP